MLAFLAAVAMSLAIWGWLREPVQPGPAAWTTVQQPVVPEGCPSPNPVGGVQFLCAVVVARMSPAPVVFST